ncbi:uncharacterized protein N7484_008049 [Penicillium longicatenatum]|uniref:uncharacterized protein n=1 Tax=Penicillium longicatenatum TaxID=1561947 RepID=UPI0025492659|nr:uncharacterized protein N7484_008049 [Penicillium longicatenatum]KAJ5640187.1 hypothetical protein N7484_008049 [Penicillium longicatenatum]
MAHSKGQPKRSGRQKSRHGDDERSDHEKITPTGNVKRGRKKDSRPEESKKVKTSSDTKKGTSKTTAKTKDRPNRGTTGKTSKSSGDLEMKSSEAATRKNGKVKDEKHKEDEQNVELKAYKGKVCNDSGKVAAVPAQSKTTQTPPMQVVKRSIFEAFVTGHTQVNLEDALKNPTPQNTKRPRKAWGPFDPPITKHAQIPEGWNPTEYDIDEQDVEANILRNIERITEGILPAFFEARLERYREMKRVQDMMVALEPDLPWVVIIRLETLGMMEERMIRDGDKSDHLVNVRAIMKAYRDRSLTWDPPKVTYWANGKLYKGPEELTTTKMNGYWRELGCPKSWFVEGWEGPEPASMNFVSAIAPRSSTNIMHDIRLAIRPADMPAELKGRNRYIEYDFLDDTGSQHMLIYEQDCWDIEDICDFICPEAGQTFVRTAAGTGIFKVVHVEAALFWDQGFSKVQVVPWTPVTCYVAPGRQLGSQPRLSGVWLRHLLYHVTRPDNEGNLYLSDQDWDASINVGPFEMANRQAPPLVAYFNEPGAPLRPAGVPGHVSPGTYPPGGNSNQYPESYHPYPEHYPGEFPPESPPTWRQALTEIFKAVMRIPQ